MQTPLRLASAIVLSVALFLSACGGTDEPSSEELAALALVDAKPVVPQAYLGSFDELVVTDIVVGTGDPAEQGRTVSMQYVGVLAADGSEFDASWDRGTEPLVFPLGGGRVIPGWDEGLVGMQVGGRRVLQIPADQAYGAESPSPLIPADADLVFIVDLVAMSPAPPEIPADALGSFDELGIIDLAEGSGDPVERGDILSVQYVGVNAADGIEFDSTWSRDNEPFLMIAGVSGVIEGWQQGLLGMKAGGERVLQIPADQAYGDNDLVFRVHLESVTPGPLAHTLTFEGPAPSEVQVTTLVDGDGEIAEDGAVLSAGVVVLRHSDSDIVESTYRTGENAVLLMSSEGLLPGLADALSGIRIGETRQVILPATVAFPEGVPAESGVAEDDALVFVVEAIESVDVPEQTTEPDE